MSNVMKVSFEEGEIKTPDKAHSSTVKLGNVTMSKTILQPGCNVVLLIVTFPSLTVEECALSGVLISPSSKETFITLDIFYPCI